MFLPSSRFFWRRLVVGGALVMAFLFTVCAPALADDNEEKQCYQQHNLVSDGFVPADTTDANLVNAWGLSAGAASFFWVSDNGTGVTTLYNGVGVRAPLVVTIPPLASAPTGQVFNPFNATNPTEFVVTDGTKSGPSLFIFVTEDGTLSGWNPGVPRTNSES